MLCTSSGTPVGAGPTGNERHDAHYSGQMPARPGAECKRPRGDRNVPRGLRGKGVRLIAADHLDARLGCD